MVKSPSQPKRLAILFLTIALTSTFVICQGNLTWESNSSAAAPLILVAGTYSLPLAINSSAPFPANLSLSSNDTNFVAEDGFLLAAQATVANDTLGAAGNVTPGLFAINFTTNNSSWSGPGVLWVNVTNTPIVLNVTPSVIVNSSSPAEVSFDLSLFAPFSDVTITATASDGNFTVSPASITFTPNSTNGTFNYSSNNATQPNSNTTVSFAINGTNAASYTFSQANQTVNEGSASNNTVLSSSAASLTIVAGTFSLPVNLSVSGANFSDVVLINASDPDFGFNPLLVSNISSNSVSTYLGSAGNVTAGNYTLSFISNDTNYPAPSNLSVLVTTNPIQIPVGDAINVSYQAGTSNSSAPVVFDLSAYAPWSDITITPNLSDGTANWTVTPASIQLTPASANASFVFQTAANATGNITSQITYVISGTDNASYVINGSQIINAISIGNATSNSSSNASNSTSGGSGINITSKGLGTNGSLGLVVSASAMLMVSVMTAIALPIMVLA